MTDPMTPTVVLAHPTRNLNRWLNTRRAHYPNMFSIDCASGHEQRMTDIGEAILTGIGKDSMLDANKRSGATSAAAWLSLGEYNTATILDTQLLPTRLLNETLEYLALFGVRSICILAVPHADPNTPKIGRHLTYFAGLGANVINETELRNSLANTAAPKPVEQGTPQPRLPRVDGIMFRSTCRDLLNADHFAAVDAEFVACVQRFRTEIGAISGQGKSDRLASLLKRDLEHTTNTDQLILHTRAAQVAAMTCGFQICVDTHYLLGAEASLPRIGKAETEQWWEHFDTYRDPDPGAAAALYSAGADAQHLPEIRLHNISNPDKNGALTCTTTKGEIFVSAKPARFLRALVAQRLYAGAAPNDRLFVTHRAAITHVKHSSRILNWSETNGGISVAATPIRKEHADPLVWLARYGIRITKLWKTAKNDKVTA